MNYRQLLKKIKLIHLAITLGLCTILSIFYLTNKADAYVSYNINDPMVLIVPLIVVISILGSKQLFHTFLRSKEKAALPEKITHYRLSAILRLALMEMGAMIGVVSFVISPNLFFLICSGLSLVYMVVLFPTSKLVARELSLDQNEYYELTKS